MKEVPQAPTETPPAQTGAPPRLEIPPLTADPRLTNIVKRSFWGDLVGDYPERRTGRIFHIDTYRINAGQNLQGMNRLERWRRLGVITLSMCDKAREDLQRYPAGAEKASTFIIAMTFVGSTVEERSLREIQQAIFGEGAISDNDRRDVLIVYNAAKYGAILVTGDTKILAAKEKLASLGARVMTDDEAVQCVEEAIRGRDAWAVEHARFMGKPIPPWVGKDG